MTPPAMSSRPTLVEPGSVERGECLRRTRSRLECVKSEISRELSDPSAGVSISADIAGSLTAPIGAWDRWAPAGAIARD
jgi:hypothetical protein